MAHKLADRERTSDVKLTKGQDIKFANMLLSSRVIKGMTQAGFITPSPIQLEAIPIGRCGFDLIVQAKSGTGKTCVFAVIALESIDTDIDFPQVLVLAPTREIVVQIAEVVTSIGSAMPKLFCHSFIGGLPIAQDKLNVRRCQIAIGTPGRIKQLIQDKILKTDSIRLFVLDEADKLLEGNFQEDINWIYYSLPDSKQMLALSATYPDELAQMLTKYMLSPTFVRLNAQSPALIGVKQFYKSTAFHPSQHRLFENKVPDVVKILESIPFGQCLIFSNFQLRAQGLCDRLNAQGWPATYLCGKQDQTKRLQAIERLRDFRCRILISTDLIARGIDVENVNLIINLDVPWDVDTYLHRIGRAGRFGSSGVAITLAATGTEEQLLQKIRTEGSLEMQELPDNIDRDILKLSKTAETPSESELATSEVATTNGKPTDHHKTAPSDETPDVGEDCSVVPSENHTLCRISSDGHSSSEELDTTGIEKVVCDTPGFLSYEELVADLENFSAGHSVDVNCCACHKDVNVSQEPERENSTQKVDQVAFQMRSLCDDFKASCERHVKPRNGETSDQLLTLFRGLVLPGQAMGNTEAKFPKSNRSAADVASPVGSGAEKSKTSLSKHVPWKSKYLVPVAEVGLTDSTDRDGTVVSESVSVQPVRRSRSIAEVSDHADQLQFECDQQTSRNMPGYSCWDSTKNVSESQLPSYDHGHRNYNEHGKSKGSDWRPFSAKGDLSQYTQFPDVVYQQRHFGLDVADDDDDRKRGWDEWYRSIQMRKCQIWYTEYFRCMLRKGYR